MFDLTQLGRNFFLNEPLSEKIYEMKSSRNRILKKSVQILSECSRNGSFYPIEKHHILLCSFSKIFQIKNLIFFFALVCGNVKLF